ncbi:MAG: AEC family transporter [Oscillospiraceae bacterium]|nr:AEC family transporter [Oscillospiraceae bacterium]
MVALQQMCILLAVMIIGYITYRVGYLTELVNEKISNIVVNVANPALILSSVTNLSETKTKDLTETVIAAVVTYGILLLCSFVLPILLRVSKSEYSVYQLMTLFNNVGFMGLPILQSLYGNAALLIAAVFLFFYNVLIYTFGVHILTKGAKPCKNNLKTVLKGLLNPGTVSCMAVLAIVFTHFQIPAMGCSIITMLGNLTAPLSMMCIGASFGGFRMKTLLGNGRLLSLSLLKLLPVPILGVLLLRFLGFTPLVVNVSMIVLATPIGSMTTMMAQQYHADSQLTAKGVALSTLLSMITIPLLTAILG